MSDTTAKAQTDSSRRRRWITNLSSRRPLTSREIAFAWIGLAVIGALAFIPRVRHGGFHSDDWSNAAGALYPPNGSGLGNAIAFFADLTIYRPVLVVYVPFIYFAFGMDMAAHLAWVAALAVVLAWLLYGVLRTLSVPWPHAWLISALTIVYPWFDSTRLWATAGQLSLSICLVIGGLWIALVGLSRRSWYWHSAAALLYLLSIFTYEITLPLVAAAGILYVLRAGWRAARARWAVDLLVASAAALWVGTHTARTASDLSGNVAHLHEIIKAGGTLLGRTLQPVGDQHTTLTLCAFALVLILGIVTCFRGADRLSRFSTDWGMKEWLLLTGGGLAVAVLGWIMFIPADPYYTPSVYGITNRVNGLAGVGLVIAAYGSLGILGTLVGQLRPRRTVLTLAVTFGLAALLGGAYVDVLRRHIGIWNSAYVSEVVALDKLRTRFPRLPPESTLFVAGYPANQTLGVPIISASWDLDGMVKVEYGDRTQTAVPVLAGTEIVCGLDGIGLIGEDESAPLTTTPYGNARLLDLPTGRWSMPSNRRTCRAVADRYVPGPLYLSYDY